MRYNSQWEHPEIATHQIKIRIAFALCFALVLHFAFLGRIICTCATDVTFPDNSVANTGNNLCHTRSVCTIVHL